MSAIDLEHMKHEWSIAKMHFWFNSQQQFLFYDFLMHNAKTVVVDLSWDWSMFHTIHDSCMFNIVIQC